MHGCDAGAKDQSLTLKITDAAKVLGISAASLSASTQASDAAEPGVVKPGSRRTMPALTVHKG
jgi:hypothetical protein